LLLLYNSNALLSKSVLITPRARISSNEKRPKSV
jgi:hypothetical protein